MNQSAPHRSFGRGKPRARGASEPRADLGARGRVFDRLCQDAETFPEIALTPLDGAGLSARDAALAGAIHHEVGRRWVTLRFLLEHHLSRPFTKLDAPVRAALLGGAAQLLLLDRVPAHAAIDTSVEWVKGHNPKAAALVNAVLRGVSRITDERIDAWDDRRDAIPLSDGSARQLKEDVLPEDALERVGVATGVPVSLIKKWSERVGEEDARALALHTLCDPPITLNVTYAEAPVEGTEAHEVDGYAVFTGAREELGKLLSSRRDVWVQDAGSGGAMDVAKDVRPSLVVDLCAGKGTKTRQLAAMFPGAVILATDVDKSRFGALSRAFAGSERVRVLGMDELRREALERADLVVLDVPCSNTGVLPRRAEAKYRVRKKQQERLMEIQRQIVADSIPLLAPDGRVLYSTCSLEPEENEAMALWLGQWHAFEVESESRTEPKGAPGEPGRVYRDGGYAALMRRK